MNPDVAVIPKASANLQAAVNNPPNPSNPEADANPQAESNPVSAHSVRKRVPLIPLGTLSENVDELEHQLGVLLKEDLSEINTSIPSLKLLAKSIKDKTKEYIDASRKLSMRYSQIASIAEAQLVRDNRTENVTVANEVIASINAFLGQLEEDEFSYCEHSSVLSGQSFAHDFNSGQNQEMKSPIQVQKGASRSVGEEKSKSFSAPAETSFLEYLDSF